MSMGVYIKGIEMPTSCSKCHISQPDGVGYICPITQGKPIVDCRQKTRHPNCPLVPVQTNGRLIESVELYGRVEDTKTKALSVCDKPQSWQFGVFWAIEQIEAALTNAPTIIPAEDEHTMEEFMYGQEGNPNDGSM